MPSRPPTSAAAGASAARAGPDASLQHSGGAQRQLDAAVEDSEVAKTSFRSPTEIKQPPLISCDEQDEQTIHEEPRANRDGEQARLHRSQTSCSSGVLPAVDLDTGGGGEDAGRDRLHHGAAAVSRSRRAASDCAHRDWPLSKAEKLDLLKVIDQNEKKIIQKELKMDQNVILKLERETRRKSMQRDYYKRRLSHYEDLSNRRSAPPSTPSQVGGWEASEDAQSLHSDAGESSLAERQLMYEDSMEMTSSAQDGSPLPIVFSEQLQNGKAKLKYLGFSTPMSKEGGRDDVVRTFHPAVAEVGKLDIDAAETENDADGQPATIALHQDQVHEHPTVLQLHPETDYAPEPSKKLPVIGRLSPRDVPKVKTFASSRKRSRSSGGPAPASTRASQEPGALPAASGGPRSSLVDVVAGGFLLGGLDAGSGRRKMTSRRASNPEPCSATKNGCKVPRAAESSSISPSRRPCTHSTSTMRAGRRNQKSFLAGDAGPPSSSIPPGVLPQYFSIHRHDDLDEGVDPKKTPLLGAMNRNGADAEEVACSDFSRKANEAFGGSSSSTSAPKLGTPGPYDPELLRANYESILNEQLNAPRGGRDNDIAAPDNVDPGDAINGTNDPRGGGKSAAQHQLRHLLGPGPPSGGFTGHGARAETAAAGGGGNGEQRGFVGRNISAARAVLTIALTTTFSFVLDVFSLLWRRLSSGSRFLVVCVSWVVVFLLGYAVAAYFAGNAAAGRPKNALLHKVDEIGAVVPGEEIGSDPPPSTDASRAVALNRLDDPKMTKFLGQKRVV